MSSEQPLEGIAIVGVAGRFPGANSVSEFWRNLLAAEETISTMSDEQLRASGLDPEALRSSGSYVPRRGLLDKPAHFDAAFFGISPREVEVMDPQQRVFLEECWAALEDAACDPARYSGAIGVFAGMSNNTYWANNVAHHPELIESVGALTAMMANEKDYLATRVAYKLNLRGPALNIYTACSTSLVAVCQAVQSLLNFACDTALAGGISITFPQERGYEFSEGGITSPDGHCRAFDEQAAGTVFSSGVGVVVLKRLADAVNDGDQIYAVIKSAALNNDGSGKVSFTAPSVDGHAEVIALAHALAGIEPRTIGYVEAHGTGTPLGDPIEIAGLTQAFRAGTDDRNFCAIGSVKTNIGHLDAAAGIAGLIKTALVLRYAKIPPSLHFTKPNPQLALTESPFYVNTSLTEWPSCEHPRRAAVSSFGVGGTNAHCILEEPPAHTSFAANSDTDSLHTIFPLSAKTDTALAQLAGNLADHIEADPELTLAEIARTLQTGRTEFFHRRAYLCSNREIAISALRNFEPKRTYAGIATKPRIVLMFPGQGAQYLGMGAQLYENEPTFRAALDRCHEALAPALDLRKVIFASGESAQSQFRETRITQPAIFAVSYALAQLWLSWGVQPVALVGHSVGEYVAATLAGVFTLEDAIRLVARRAELVQAQPRGAMLAVRLSESEASNLADEQISLAAINSPKLCVLAGSDAAIAAIESDLSAQGVATKHLETSHAFHSAMMDAVIAPLESAIEKVERHTPRTPIVSTVNADWLSAEDATDPHYWSRHARDPVHFSPAIARLLTEPNHVFIECGPGQTLTQLVRQHGSANRVVVTSIREGAGEIETLHAALAQLWTHGASVKWDAIRHGGRPVHVTLPAYPFERQRYFAEPVVCGKSTPSLRGSITSTATNSTTQTDAVPAIEAGQAPDNASIKASLPSQILIILSELSGNDLTDADPHLSFVELGFDSLSLTQAAIALHKTFRVKVTFRQLLQDLPSPATLAEYLEKLIPARTDESPRPATRVSEKSTAAPQASKPHGPFRAIDRTANTLTAAQQSHLDDLIARYTARTSKSKSAIAEHRAHLADPRAVAGFRREWKEMIYPLICERSEGSKLWDADGNEYTDITLGFGQILFGHRPQWLIEAIEHQLHSGIEIGPTSPLAGQLAKRLSQYLGLERVAFCNTGSEAVAAALRLARTVTGRDKVAVFSGAYHGIFDEVLFRPGPAPIAPGIPASAVHLFAFTAHHIVCDGWSFAIIAAEVAELYSAKAQGRPAQIELALDFREYSKEQHARIGTEQDRATEAWWLAQFTTLPTSLDLPTDEPRPNHRAFNAATRSTTLPAEVCESLRKLSAANQATIFSTLLAAFYTLLHRLSGQTDIVVGIASAGQTTAGNGALVGHCVNFLPLRLALDGAQSFDKFLHSVNNLVLDAREHHDFTFGRLLTHLALPRDPSRIPLVSVSFNVDRAPTTMRFDTASADFAPLEKTRYGLELSFNLIESDGGYRLFCHFNRDLFAAETIKRWLGHYNTLLAAIADSPATPIDKLALLTPEESSHILNDWNATSRPYPREIGLDTLFEQNVARTPTAVTIVHGVHSLTYAELNVQANRIAHRLLASGMQPGALVGLCSERSIELVASMLAIVKAGGAYVPLDPTCRSILRAARSYVAG